MEVIMNYPKNRNNEKRRLSHKEFLDKLYLVKDKNEYGVLSKYVLSREKMKFIHIPCGTKFECTPNCMLRKHHCPCPKCGQLKRTNTKRVNSSVNIETISSKVQELYPDEYYTLVLEKTKYINNKKKTICLRCSRCGGEFYISYVNLCKKRGCPVCNKINRQESKNVKLIKEFLTENNIPYKLEYKIDDCRNIRVLPFDFMIDENHLIEYDGEFHDKGYNNNAESLKRVKENDQIKTQYCIDHNIKLLRLRYNNFDNYKEKILEFIKV